MENPFWRARAIGSSSSGGIFCFYDLDKFFGEEGLGPLGVGGGGNFTLRHGSVERTVINLLALIAERQRAGDKRNTQTDFNTIFDRGKLRSIADDL